MARPMNVYDPFSQLRGRAPARVMGRFNEPGRDAERRLRNLENDIARLQGRFAEFRSRTMADIKALLDKLEDQNTVSAGYRVAVDEKLARM